MAVMMGRLASVPENPNKFVKNSFIFNISSLHVILNIGNFT
jgi:hypothetical protein